MKIIGLGNALVDLLVNLENEDLLLELDLPKGSMTLINKEKADDISIRTKSLSPQLATGGSASNTVSALARMETQCAFVGKSGKDDLGDFYATDLKKHGVKPIINIGDLSTGCAMTLISPDGERTFGTYLGAAATLTASEIETSLFEGYDLLHIEGYLVQSYDLIEKAMLCAKNAGCKISLDLASYNIVEENLEFLTKLVEKYVDIVFANEEESKAFTGKDPEEALDVISEMVTVAIVKIGPKGSLVKSKNEMAIVSSFSAKCLDSTGAGDGYAAGFIYGLTQGFSLYECGLIGTFVAGQVIQVVGPKLNDEQWQIVFEKIEKVREAHGSDKIYI